MCNNVVYAQRGGLPHKQKRHRRSEGGEVYTGECTGPQKIESVEWRQRVSPARERADEEIAGLWDRGRRVACRGGKRRRTQTRTEDSGGGSAREGHDERRRFSHVPVAESVDRRREEGARRAARRAQPSQ